MWSESDSDDDSDTYVPEAADDTKTQYVADLTFLQNEESSLGNISDSDEDNVLSLIRKAKSLNISKTTKLQQLRQYLTNLQDNINSLIAAPMTEASSDDDNDDNSDMIIQPSTSNIQPNVSRNKLLDACFFNEDDGLNIAESESQPTKVLTTIYCFGMPYFKDEINHSFRKNDEWLKMDANGVILPIYIPKPTKWKQSHFIQLKNAVATFMPFRKTVSRSANDNEFWSLYDTERHNSMIDWYKISDQVFDGVFSQSECETLWTIYLQPKVNKSNWTAHEKKMLLSLAKQNFEQNWNDIAVQLGTNRSGYQCFLFYLQKFKMFHSKDNFTIEDDKKLLKILMTAKFGSYISWKKIAYYFETKSKNQLFFRFTQRLSNLNNSTRYLSRQRKSSSMPALMRRFTPNEDATLINAIKRHGVKSWKMFADKYFHEVRTPDQLRHRFNFLKGRYKKTVMHSHDMRLTVKNAAAEIDNAGPVPSTSQVSIPDVEGRRRPKRAGRKLGQAKPMSTIDRNLINFFRSSISLPGRRKKYVAADYVEPINECLTFLNVESLRLSDINLDEEYLWTDLEKDIVSSLKENGHKMADKTNHSVSLMPLNLSNAIAMRYILQQDAFIYKPKHPFGDHVVQSEQFQRFKDRFHRTFYAAGIASIAIESDENPTPSKSSTDQNDDVINLNDLLLT